MVCCRVVMMMIGNIHGDMMVPPYSGLILCYNPEPEHHNKENIHIDAETWSAACQHDVGDRFTDVADMCKGL